MCSVHVDIELMAALYKRARMSQVFVVDAKQYEKLIKAKTIQTKFNPKFYSYYIEFSELKNNSQLLAILHTDFAGGEFKTHYDSSKIVYEFNTPPEAMIDSFLLREGVY